MLKVLLDYLGVSQCSMCTSSKEYLPFCIVSMKCHCYGAMVGHENADSAASVSFRDGATMGLPHRNADTETGGARPLSVSARLEAMVGDTDTHAIAKM